MKEQEIVDASVDYQMSTRPRAMGGDAFYDFVRESNVNQDFIAGAKWIEKQMIEKACEWLENNTISVTNDTCTYTASSYDISKEEFIEQFKKAMEE